VHIPVTVSLVIAMSIILAHNPPPHVAVTPIFLAYSHVTPVFLAYFSATRATVLTMAFAHPAIVLVVSHLIRSCVDRSCSHGCNNQPADCEDMPDFHISSH
jgi:hypothetical protein